MTVTHSKLAFIFPGQGSQSKGMLAELSQEFTVVLDTFEEASNALGYDLWHLLQEDTESQLNQTEFTQPAMLASGIAAWRVWCASTDVRPGFVAGHSLGEYSALVAAEALDFGDALKLVQTRGRLMQAAVPKGVGAMAAILGLADEAVVKVCQNATEADHSVEAANFNGPGQVVISGHAAAVDRAIELAKAAGAKRAVLLPVSGPFHSTLMKGAGERFRVMLEDTVVKAPRIPVIHNVDVAQHQTPEQIRLALTNQISGSVRWTETIRAMVDHGVGQFIECGPGKVLQGLNKRIDANVVSESIFDPGSLTKALELVI
jgi:[acyl-carrier-protein] S-malonyltransferase